MIIDLYIMKIVDLSIIIKIIIIIINLDDQEEERRKILKMLISPSSERKPKQTLDEFMMRTDQDQVNNLDD